VLHQKNLVKKHWTRVAQVDREEVVVVEVLLEEEVVEHLFSLQSLGCQKTTEKHQHH
jgi:hypothetical protein